TGGGPEVAVQAEFGGAQRYRRQARVKRARGFWSQDCPELPRFSRSRPGVSDAEPLLQLPDAVAGDGELGLLVVLQAHQDAAVDRGEELLHERDVDDRRAMDAREAARVEARLELAQREVDDVLAAARAGECQLVLRD